MKTFTIVGGVNGVGKSSLTGVLMSEVCDLGVIIDANKIALDFDGDKIKGGKESIRRIESYLNKGINFTQETTLSGVKTKRTVTTALEKNYHIRLYYVGVNELSESLGRIENRVKKGGHNIPVSDVERRYNECFKNVADILPLCHEATFYDNENGFIAVGEYQNGELYLTNDYKPKWIVDFMTFLSDYQIV